MLEKPNINEKTIANCLQNAYALVPTKITFLALGADLDTAVYRITANDETSYFLKLRRGNFSQAGAAVPKYLSDLGIRQIIPPLATQTGRLWTNLAPFKVMLYPYVAGRNGYEMHLSDQHWLEFGRALKMFHTADIPAAITKDVCREEFSPQWRATVKKFLSRIENDVYDEAVALELAAFLQSTRDETLEIVSRAERLAAKLRADPPDFILCHADIHAWNLLIDEHGALYMVDWDTLIFAPKERDLMFIGGGLGGGTRTAHEEENLFYQGYGPTHIDPIAIAYYRYERIIEDIAVICEQIFLMDQGGEDRVQALGFLKSNFLPNSTIEIAYRSDKTWEIGVVQLPSEPRKE